MTEESVDIKPIILKAVATALNDQTDTAWGRSRFTESEIKKAFEAIDNENKRLEEENLAFALPTEKSKNSKKYKGDFKRDEEKKRREEKKKSKDDRKRIGKDKRKNSRKNFSDSDDLDDTEESRDDSDWDSISNTNDEYYHLDNSDEKKSESFEDFDTNVFDPFKLHAQIEESLEKSNNKGHDFSQLDAKVTMIIFSNLSYSELLTCSKVCKYWKELTRSKEMWKERFKAFEAHIFNNENDVNIWDELGTDFTNVNKDEKLNVKEASLNKLVAAVTPQAELPDRMDVNTFITTYQTFTTTKKIIRKLTQRYQVPEKTMGTPEEIKKFNVVVVTPIQLRVCKLLKGIIETHTQDIDKDLLSLLRLFVLGVVDQAVLAKLLQSAIVSFLKKGSKVVEENTLSEEDLSKRPTLTSIFELSTEEIAKQLSLIEFETYNSIQPAEFFGQAWSKAKTYHRSPNIRAMINRFNEITKWVVTEIVSQEKLRNRVKRFIKFIKVAQHLHSMRNYHTLMAILGGLGDGPLYRLKFTNAEIPVKYQTIYKDLQTLMSADGSYHLYRAELVSVQPPCIPYLGIYLRDLTYFEEGGASDNGLINFKSKKNVYSVIQIIQKYQSTPFDVKKIERAYNSLKTLSYLDDESLFKISLLREPRNAKTKAEIQ